MTSMHVDAQLILPLTVAASTMANGAHAATCRVGPGVDPITVFRVQQLSIVPHLAREVERLSLDQLTVRMPRVIRPILGGAPRLLRVVVFANTPQRLQALVGDQIMYPRPKDLVYDFYYHPVSRILRIAR